MKIILFNSSFRVAVLEKSVSQRKRKYLLPVELLLTAPSAGVRRSAKALVNLYPHNVYISFLQYELVDTKYEFLLTFKHYEVFNVSKRVITYMERRRSCYRWQKRETEQI